MSSSCQRGAMHAWWTLLISAFLLFSDKSLGFQTRERCTTRTRPESTSSTNNEGKSLLREDLSSLSSRNFGIVIPNAIIYGGGDDDGDYMSEEEFDATAMSTTTISAVDQDLKQLVSDGLHSSELPASYLINLACAQAPSPHNHLLPQDCLSSELVSVSTMGAQIGLSILAPGGQDGRCVQLLIPVSFAPNEVPPPSLSSSSDEMVDYIVQQFQRLESTSLNSIAKKEWKEDHTEQLRAQERILFELQDEGSLADQALPDWWTFCDLNQGLEEESSQMKNLLNEDDFATDLNKLFQTNYHDFYKGKEPIQTIKTCVTSIGPSGVYLRSYVERLYETNEKYFNAELAIPFPEKTLTRDSMRSSILLLIESTGESVSVEEVVEEQEEAPFPETIEEVVDKSYTFQEALLRARIQIDQFAISRRQNQKEDTFHRAMLATRLSMELEKAKVATKAERSVVVGVAPESQQQQPLSPSTAADLADKYASIEDLGERAYAILKDLGMV